MRLNKYLSQNGICSRRDADKLIETGKVSVNGKVIVPPAPILLGNEVVTVDGKTIKPLEKNSLWLFYKPQGLVTTHKDEKNRNTVFNYLKQHGIKEHVISVGRLDMNSEGLLLITNSTKFANFAESPKNAWKREYRVRVYGDVNNIDFNLLTKGIEIDGISYKGIDCELEKDSDKFSKNNWLRITLIEGKNREIRKVMEHFNLQVNRLIRTNYGPYSLEGIKCGEVRKASINLK